VPPTNRAPGATALSRPWNGTISVRLGDCCRASGARGPLDPARHYYSRNCPCGHNLPAFQVGPAARLSCLAVATERQRRLPRLPRGQRTTCDRPGWELAVDEGARGESAIHHKEAACHLRSVAH
jgi:hypothetical protein